MRLHDKNADDALETLLNRRYMGPLTVSVISENYRISLTRIERGMVHQYLHGPSVVVLHHRFLARDLEESYINYARSIKLTRAEYRVFLQLIRGKSISEIASEAGLSKETIRTQSKSLYAKCGTPNKSIILREALKLPI